jgi:hypothetical protein
MRRNLLKTTNYSQLCVYVNNVKLATKHYTDIVLILTGINAELIFET